MVVPRRMLIILCGRMATLCGLTVMLCVDGFAMWVEGYAVWVPAAASFPALSHTKGSSQLAASPLAVMA